MQLHGQRGIRLQVSVSLKMLSGFEIQEQLIQGVRVLAQGLTEALFEQISSQ
jgi:hypothetical protein